MSTVRRTALKIVPQTYPVYLGIQGIVHLKLNAVNNLFLVFDPDLPKGRGWFEENDFRKNYKWAEEVSKLAPTEIERINTEF